MPHAQLIDPMLETLRRVRLSGVRRYCVGKENDVPDQAACVLGKARDDGAACRPRRHIYATALLTLTRVLLTRLIVVAAALLLTLSRRISARRLLGRRLPALSRLTRVTRRIVLLALLLLVRARIASAFAFLFLILTFVLHS